METGAVVDAIQKMNLGYIKYGMLLCSKLSKVTSYLGMLSGNFG